MTDSHTHDIQVKVRFNLDAKKGEEALITGNFVGIILSTPAGNFEGMLDLRAVKHVAKKVWFEAPVFLLDPEAALNKLTIDTTFVILKFKPIGEGIVLRRNPEID